MKRERTFEWDEATAFWHRAEGKSGLELLRMAIAGELPPPPMARLMDIRLTQVDKGKAIFTGTPQEFHYNPLGSVHGGYGATLLDSAMGCAVMTTLDEKSAYTTVQLNVNLTRGITVNTGRLIAESRIVQRGARIAVADGKLIDAKGTLFAHSTTTCMIMPRTA